MAVSGTIQEQNEFKVYEAFSVQFSSVAQSCPTLCDPMNRSTPGLPVHHQLLEFTQTLVCWVGDAIQPSHPLSSPSPPALNLSQHQRKVFLYSSVYSCQLFLISSASVRSILCLSFIEPIFAWNVPLVSLIFLKRSLVFPILLYSLLYSLFLCIDRWGRLSYLSLLFFGTLHSNQYIFPFWLLNGRARIWPSSCQFRDVCSFTSYCL